MTRRRPVIADRTHEITLAVALWAAGLYLMWDAWDNRGRRRPWPIRAATPF